MQSTFSFATGAAILLVSALALQCGGAAADENGGRPMQWGGAWEHGDGNGFPHGFRSGQMACEGDADKCRADMEAQRLERLKQWFEKADKDGNGTLSRTEVEQSMPMFAAEFDQIDTNKDGQITLEEFEAYNKKKMDEFAAKRQECETDPDKCHAEMLDHMKDMFKRADTNGDGFLTVAEAEKGAPMIAHRFYELDANKDGRVSLKEFNDFYDTRYEEFRKKRLAAMNRLTQQFNKADLNHDDLLSMAEAEKGMPELAKCFAEVDANHDGMISLEEAKAFISTSASMRHHHGRGMGRSGWHSDDDNGPHGKGKMRAGMPSDQDGAPY
jgi:Ca2+-binding EF-hand superfamily protein